MINHRTFRFLAAIAALLVLSTIAYAFAASITVPDTNAGYGDGTVGGYAITDVTYTLDTNPTNLDTVAIVLSTAADHVEARITGSGAWVVCTGAGTNWSCPVGGAVVDAVNLEVIAYTNY
jgi:hypothetical protein